MTTTCNILFDQWGTQAQIQQSTQLRLNTLLGAIGSAGVSSKTQWSASFSTDPITATQLANANALVILTRAAVDDQDNQQFAYGKTEIDCIEQWVAAGGGLLLISNHPNYGVNDAVLASRFGIAIDTQHFIAMPDQQPVRPLMVMSGTDLNFADAALAALFLGVDSLATHDACGISTSQATAKVLASFPAGAVVAPSGKPPPAGESFGVLVPWGKGQVIVLGNSGICGDNGTPSPACGTISYGSNLMFILNCLRVLGGQPQAAYAGKCPLGEC